MSLSHSGLGRDAGPGSRRRRRACGGRAGRSNDGAFADELDASYDDENRPFAGDPIVMPACVELTIVWEAWGEEARKIVGTAHRHGPVVLDPQEEQLYPPESFAVS